MTCDRVVRCPAVNRSPRKGVGSIPTESAILKIFDKIHLNSFYPKSGNSICLFYDEDVTKRIKECGSEAVWNFQRQGVETL